MLLGSEEYIAEAEKRINADAEYAYKKGDFRITDAKTGRMPYTLSR